MSECLQRGTKLEAGLVLCKKIDGEKDWAIYRSFSGVLVLAVSDGLLRQWCDAALIDAAVFRAVPMAEGIFYACAGMGTRLEYVENAAIPASVEEALSFAAALRETRRRCSADLQDAIFFEAYTRLLPLTDTAQHTADDLVLGQWLTGGVSVSAMDAQRIARLMTWIPPEEIRHIVCCAGLAPAEETNDDVMPAERPRTDFVLYGRTELTQFFRDYVIDIVERQEEYARMGIHFPGAILMYGPPGSGKTYAAEQLAAYLGWPQYTVNASSIGSKYIHETGQKIAALFDAAREAAPSIVIIDEMEAFLSARDSRMAGLHHTEEVGEFLRLLQDARVHRILVLGMTNRLDEIDPAVRRKGRFDHIIEVGMPSKGEITALLQKKLADVPVAEDLSLEEIAERLCGASMAEIAYLVQEAGRRAVRRHRSCISHDIMEEAMAALTQP